MGIHSRARPTIASLLVLNKIGVKKLRFRGNEFQRRIENIKNCLSDIKCCGLTDLKFKHLEDYKNSSFEYK